MKALFKKLYDTNQKAGVYLWDAALICLIPYWLITIILGSIYLFLGNGPQTLYQRDVQMFFNHRRIFHSFHQTIPFIIFQIIIFAPWMETLLMQPILSILKKFIPKNKNIAICSAIVWGWVHFFQMPIRGMFVLWPFFIFSLTFLAWETISIKKAIIMTGVLHMIFNLIPCVFLIMQFGISSEAVRQGGHSMEPTMKEGEVFIVNRAAYHKENPKRWDVIVFNAFNNHIEGWDFRVVGLPSETIDIKAGEIYINGQIENIPNSLKGIKFLPTIPGRNGLQFPFKIPSNSYFVLGDNPNIAPDSRFWGPVLRTDIRGKVIVK